MNGTPKSVFDYIKSIYIKSKIDTSEINMSMNIAITKWLLLDEDNIHTIDRVAKFLYWVAPLTYFYLLYFNIGKKEKPPFLYKVDKEVSERVNKLFNKVKETLGWSDRELKFYSRLLDKTVLINKKYWERELAVA